MMNSKVQTTTVYICEMGHTMFTGGDKPTNCSECGSKKFTKEPPVPEMVTKER